MSSLLPLLLDATSIVPEEFNDGSYHYKNHANRM